MATIKITYHCGPKSALTTECPLKLMGLSTTTVRVGSLSCRECSHHVSHDKSEVVCDYDYKDNEELFPAIF